MEKGGINLKQKEKISNYGRYLLELLRNCDLMELRMRLLGADNLAENIYREILAPLGW